jgi:hypothetical protein
VVLLMLRQRQPRVRNPDYLAWIAKGWCVACYVQNGRLNPEVHVAHVRMPSAAHDKRETGKAEKPDDRWTLPLCPGHHLDAPGAQHRVGERVFWSCLDVDPLDLCLALQEAHALRALTPRGAIIHFCADARSKAIARTGSSL